MLFAEKEVCTEREMAGIFKQLLVIDPPQHHMIDTGGAFPSLCSWHFHHPFYYIVCKGLLSRKAGHGTVPCPALLNSGAKTPIWKSQTRKHNKRPRSGSGFGPAARVRFYRYSRGRATRFSRRYSFRQGLDKPLRKRPDRSLPLHLAQEEQHRQHQRGVEENSTVALDQDVYTKRYDGLIQRYEAAKGKLTELQKKRAGREKKAEAINRFMQRLAERDEPLTTFTDGLWLDSIDLVTVRADGTLAFRFQDGNEAIV